MKTTDQKTAAKNTIQIALEFAKQCKAHLSVPCLVDKGFTLVLHDSPNGAIKKLENGTFNFSANFSNAYFWDKKRAENAKFAIEKNNPKLKGNITIQHVNDLAKQGLKVSIQIIKTIRAAR